MTTYLICPSVLVSGCGSWTAKSGQKSQHRCYGGEGSLLCRELGAKDGRGRAGSVPVYTDLLRFLGAISRQSGYRLWRNTLPTVLGGWKSQSHRRRATPLAPHQVRDVCSRKPSLLLRERRWNRPQPSHPDTTQFSTMSSATWKKWFRSNGRTVLSGGSRRSSPPEAMVHPWGGQLRTQWITCLNGARSHSESKRKQSGRAEVVRAI